MQVGNKIFLFGLSLLFSAAAMLSVSNGGFAKGKKNSRGEVYLQAAERFAKSQIVQDKNCVTCHTIGNSGGTVGPNLNQIGNRRTDAWLRKWLKDPNQIRPGTKMPNFGFSDADIETIMSYFKDMRRDIDSDKILAQGDPVKAGEALFAAYDCYACHRIGDQGRFVGPNLTWVGVRKSQDWEAIWLRDPPAYKPGTFMPNFHLSEAEITALTAFLHAQQGQANAQARKWETMTGFILDARPRERGRMVAERLACWSCHGENLEGGVKNPNASPDESVPALTTAFIDFDEDDLVRIILDGSKPQKLDPQKPEPPFACPAWRNALTGSEVQDLLAYLESLVPESANWEFQ